MNASTAAASTTQPRVTDVMPTEQELIDRARAMIPALKQRARQTTAQRRIPDETIAEMQAAGFFRILQPKRWGGYEMHPNVFFEVQKLLAEGCMSTGWVYGVVGGHPYELALFPDQAQVDVWGDDDSILISSSYQPVGKVQRVDGGFTLSGRWGFSSGSEHCQWVLLGAMIPPAKEGDPPDMRTFLLPRSDRTSSSRMRSGRSTGPTNPSMVSSAKIRVRRKMTRRCSGFPGRRFLSGSFRPPRSVGRRRPSKGLSKSPPAVFRATRARLPRAIRSSLRQSPRPTRRLTNSRPCSAGIWTR